MARNPRASVGGLCYHVLNRGNNRRRVFRKDGDYFAFLKAMAHACIEIPMRVLGYCLMPNHFHLVKAGKRRRPEQVDALAAEHARAPLPQTSPEQRTHLAGPLQGFSRRTGRLVFAQRCFATSSGTPCEPNWFGVRRNGTGRAHDSGSRRTSGRVFLWPDRCRGRPLGWTG